MNAARQISRRFGRTIGARTRSDSSDCIVRTVSFGPDHLKTHAVLKAADPTGACERDYESVLAHYGVYSAAELTRKLHSIEGFKPITSPMRELPDTTWVPDFTPRYFTEDTVGTMAIQSRAREYKISTPIIDTFIAQISNMPRSVRMKVGGGCDG